MHLINIFIIQKAKGLFFYLYIRMKRKTCPYAHPSISSCVSNFLFLLLCSSPYLTSKCHENWQFLSFPSHTTSYLCHIRTSQHSLLGHDMKRSVEFYNFTISSILSWLTSNIKGHAKCSDCLLFLMPHERLNQDLLTFFHIPFTMERTQP